LRCGSAAREIEEIRRRRRGSGRQRSSSRAALWRKVWELLKLVSDGEEAPARVLVARTTDYIARLPADSGSKTVARRWSWSLEAVRHVLVQDQFCAGVRRGEYRSAMGIARIARSTPWPNITSRRGQIAREDSDLFFPKSVGFVISFHFLPRENDMTRLLEFLLARRLRFLC
jgi:hypothetical protein